MLMIKLDMIHVLGQVQGSALHICLFSGK